MRLGFETIGNATIIAYDKKPTLATDPWIQGPAYFGSWALSHVVPEEQIKAILDVGYVWFSHGHPDHLNPECLPLFKGKKILLPNHFGGRIRKDLVKDGFDVHVLEDGKWRRLSDNIRVMCLSDIGQDAILLIDIAGRLLVNSNDAGENGWTGFIRRTTRRFSESYLLRLSGFGDADMLNFYDEDGHFIEPEPMKKRPFGKDIAMTAIRHGCSRFIPTSSLHRYQRSDSAWANAMTPSLEDYSVGAQGTGCEILPAFLSVDFERARYSPLNPPETEAIVHPPEKFGDNWSDVLEAEDVKKATSYFQAVECLSDHIGFIELRVGNRSHTIDIPNGPKGVGVTFEAPRQSLMTSIEYEIFDDMMIGNFMKTTLHGKWPAVSLHPWFAGYVAKWADNGRAKTRAEVASYIREYEKRCPALKRQRQFNRMKETFAATVGRNTFAFRFAKRLYHLAR